MSAIGDVLTLIAEDVLPNVIAPNVFPDLMTITRPQAVQGTGGGMVKSADTEIYSDVPVTYKARAQHFNNSVGDKLQSVAEYDLTFPAFWDGERLNIDASYGLKIQERGENPEMTFRIKAIKRNQGVTITAICELEE